MKAFTAGNQALGLWVRAGSWSMHQLSDGFIPRGVVAALGGEWDDAVALIQAGLWHEAPGGYQFHDWAEYQPTKVQVLAERAAATERKRASRARSQGVSQRDEHVTDGGSPPSPSRPVPTRPNDSSKTFESQSSSKRASDSMDPFEVSEHTAASAARKGLTDLAAIAHHIEEKTGIRLDAFGVMTVANNLLDKAKDYPKAPQRYVLGSITRSAPEVAKFIHDSGLA